MSPVVLEIILFIVGLGCLVKGGDWFVDGSCGIAHRFNMPEILIGATVVSIGTTIPEVMVSATAALTSGASDMAYGNAIGSIICNTALISAITMAVRPAPVEKGALKMPMLFFFAAAVFYAVIAYTTGFFARPVGIVLLIGFVVYMVISIKQATGSRKNDGEKADGVSEDASANAEVEVSTDSTENTDKKASFEESIGYEVLLIVLGAAVIAVGARLLVNNGTLLAEAAGVPKSVIALTFVALGTSLPELVTAITALVKGHSDLSLGNVIGANLFNLVLVSGLACTLAPFHVPVEKTIAGMNASLIVDVPIMFIVMLIMCVPSMVKGKLYRGQGIALLAIYFGYIIFQFV